jgi:hypothetical protein
MAGRSLVEIAANDTPSDFGLASLRGGRAPSNLRHSVVSKPSSFRYPMQAHPFPQARAHSVSKQNQPA